MDMNLFKKIVWRLYLWLFIPKNLWYYDRNNGTVIVVPARFMEDVFRLYNNDARRGSIERIYTHVIGYSVGPRRHLIFSDNPLYLNSKGNRASEGVVGSLADFDRFCHYFPVQHRALYIPGANTMRQEGQMFGQMNDPEKFNGVLSYAEELMRR